MDIVKACQVIRDCNDSFVFGLPMHGPYGAVVEAVRVLKSYLEQVRGDGKSIRALEITDYLICTPEAIRLVMPYVYSAESLAAASRRRAQVAS